MPVSSSAAGWRAGGGLIDILCHRADMSDKPAPTIAGGCCDLQGGVEESSDLMNRQDAKDAERREEERLLGLTVTIFWPLLSIVRPQSIQ